MTSAAPYTTETLKRDLVRLSLSGSPYAFVYGSPWDVGMPALELSAARMSAARVVALRRKGHAELATGEVSFSEGNRQLIFHTSGEPVVGMTSSIIELIGYPCAGFREVVVEQSDTASGVDLSAQVGVLDALGEAPVAFWFADGGAGGSMLLLAADNAALKALVQGNDHDGARTVRGRLTRSKKGFPLFQARKTFPGFVAALAGWVQAHHGAWPGLRALGGARMVVKNASGEIIDRRRDADAWSFLH
ncbi:MAG: hypothetical protein ACI8RZ_001173 [Myxococcota bacterium]